MSRALSYLQHCNIYHADAKGGEGGGVGVWCGVVRCGLGLGWGGGGVRITLSASSMRHIPGTADPGPTKTPGNPKRGAYITITTTLHDTTQSHSQPHQYALTSAAARSG